MIAQYKKAIIKIKAMLNDLVLDQGNLKLLLDIQLEIIKYILMIEKRIRKLKTMGESTSSAKHALFQFKAFGDALAFVYIDRFNLKQLAYNIDNVKFKNRSGFITDKDGFQNELNMLKEFLDSDYPCMLCDITNSIRYGDILMLFSGGDPIIVECKTKKQNSMRERRQVETLKKLDEFYEKDIKKMKKGTLTVTRSSTLLPLVTYEEKMNILINEARKKGAASEQIEKGLYYFVFFDKSKIATEIQKYKIAHIWSEILNEWKDNDANISYYPFPLLIEKPIDYLEFLMGEYTITVVIDASKIGKKLANKGVVFETEENSDYPFEFYIMNKATKEAESTYAISIHIINRIFLEFISLDWLIKDTYERWIKKELNKTTF